VETYWRVVGPSGRELSCGFYRTIAGLELRCGYTIDDLLRSRRISPRDDARYLAAGWLHWYRPRGLEVIESNVADELEQMRDAL
jgi:hypothetical protein